MNEVQYSNIGKNIIYNCHEQTEVQKMNNGIVVFSINRVNQDQKMGSNTIKVIKKHTLMSKH